MATSNLRTRLGALAKKLASLQVEFTACVHELESLLDLAAHAESRRPPIAERFDHQIRIGPFIVDRATFSVSSGKRVCCLGNTVCFRLLEHIAGQPNRFLDHSDLLAAVWDGQRRAGTTIRRAVFVLRKQLRKVGMHDLAEAIRSEGRAYGLTLNTRLKSPNGKTTQKQRKNNA